MILAGCAWSAHCRDCCGFSEELGLDKPPHIRYFDWIAGVVQGDLGTSFSGRAASGRDRSREVAELIAPRLQNTLFLAGITALVSVPLALILGISTALYRNSIYDRSINTVTLTTISFPEFFVAYILILLLSSLNQWLPSLANVDSSTPLGERSFEYTASLNAHSRYYSSYDENDEGGDYQFTGCAIQMASYQALQGQR